MLRLTVVALCEENLQFSVALSHNRSRLNPSMSLNILNLKK